MKVFVIVVTYNGRKWYDRCFLSLRESQYPVTTIVIDNASSDDTVDYLTTNYPELIIFASSKNVGFGQANNMGMNYALKNDAEAVFLLNQDAWVEPDTISLLINTYNNNTEYGIISPMHLNAKKDKIDFGVIKYISNYSPLAQNIIHDWFFHVEKDIYETNYINAAAWLLPKKTLKVVGGFDPIFFLYGEDDNYMQRCKYHNFKIGIVPKSRIVHDRENRTMTKEGLINMYYKQVLVDATNVLLEYNFKQWLKYIHLTVKSLLKGKLQVSKRYLNTIQFLASKRKAIKHSRYINQTTTKAWLD